MTRPLARLLVVALILTPSLLPVGTATTYVALDPYEVLARADAVLTARVADVRTESRDQYVWTVVTLDATEWLTDDPAQDDDADEPAEPRDTLELEFLGGESGGRRLLVAGSISWDPDSEVLIAIYEQAGSASPVVGFRQGMWRIADDGLTDPDGRALALDAAGRLVRADRPAAATTVLDAVRLALEGEAPAPQEEAGEPEETEPVPETAAPPDGERTDGEGPEGDAAEEEPADGERPPADPTAPDSPVAPAVPTETIARSYAVDDAGGPLLLSDRLETAAAAWESLAPGAVDLTASSSAEHRFAYGEDALFGPDLLSLTLVEEGGVDVLVRPDDHQSVDAALRHELGVLLGLGPSATGVMSMAVATDDVAPGDVELAELAAISAFAPEDLDRDGVVGFGDLLELAAAYGRSGLNLPGDLDGDGDVDADDLAVLRQAYTFSPPLGDGQEEPEPLDSEEAPDQATEEAEDTEEPADPDDPSETEQPDEPDEPEGPEEPDPQPPDPGG